MATFDVRDSVEEKITEIWFAEATDENDDPNAYALLLCDNVLTSIVGGDTAEVFINDKQHAQNLIKALNKAIELGWLK